MTPDSPVVPEGSGPPPLQGRTIAGRYRLDGIIGAGGVGTVWSATDEVLGRAVAVKDIVAPHWFAADEKDSLRERTLREARATARIGQHPNVVTVYDVVEQDGRLWIVMQLVQARSLAEVIDEDGPCRPAEVARIGIQVLDGLRAAHSHGILHRDVKPSNVLVDDDGRAILTDFGIATVDGDTTLTGTGVLMGAPAYIAPERTQGAPADTASDLWALGATLYTAVEGKPPFQRDGAFATLAAAINEDPDPAEHAGPLEPLLVKLLARDPADRPDHEEVTRELWRIAVGTSGAGGPAALDGFDAATWPNAIAMPLQREQSAPVAARAAAAAAASAVAAPSAAAAPAPASAAAAITTASAAADPVAVTPTGEQAEAVDGAEPGATAVSAAPAAASARSAVSAPTAHIDEPLLHADTPVPPVDPPASDVGPAAVPTTVDQPTAVTPKPALVAAVSPFAAAAPVSPAPVPVPSPAAVERPAGRSRSRRAVVPVAASGIGLVAAAVLGVVLLQSPAGTGEQPIDQQVIDTVPGGPGPAAPGDPGMPGAPGEPVPAGVQQPGPGGDVPAVRRTYPSGQTPVGEPAPPAGGGGGGGPTSAGPVPTSGAGRPSVVPTRPGPTGAPTTQPPTTTQPSPEPTTDPPTTTQPPQTTAAADPPPPTLP